MNKILKMLNVQDKAVSAIKDKWKSGEVKFMNSDYDGRLLVLWFYPKIKPAMLTAVKKALPSMKVVANNESFYGGTKICISDSPARKRKAK